MNKWIEIWPSWRSIFLGDKSDIYCDVISLSYIYLCGHLVKLIRFYMKNNTLIFGAEKFSLSRIHNDSYFKSRLDYNTARLNNNNISSTYRCIISSSGRLPLQKENSEIRQILHLLEPYKLDRGVDELSFEIANSYINEESDLYKIDNARLDNLNEPVEGNGITNENELIRLSDYKQMGF